MSAIFVLALKLLDTDQDPCMRFDGTHVLESEFGPVDVQILALLDTDQRVRLLGEAGESYLLELPVPVPRSAEAQVVELLGHRLLDVPANSARVGDADDAASQVWSSGPPPGTEGDLEGAKVG